jgi:hypothetical protein
MKRKIDFEKRVWLCEKFGSRVSFNKTERKLYGHDIAAMPGLFKPLIGNTTLEAVVQPETEAEIVELVRWAVANNIPLTPRAKASSGYGGVIPIKQGVVVDFYRMKRVLRIDPEARMATVEAGVVWEALDKELAKHGLTLRFYPTSYPSSTAGGWLAQGGAGIGSYEAGWYRDNVLSVEVVLPTGEVREFLDGEMDLIADAEGITGLITQVTLKVQPLEELDVVCVGCPNPHDLQGLIESIIAAEIGKIRLNEAVEAGAEKVLALCPCCEFQFRVTVDKKKVPMEIVDLARFASSALGYEFPDPHPEVRAQWAVFEAMIALMTPEGFADLMKTIWPELIEAMPFGMGKMMRLFGKIPGVLNLMKPMFPILFPKLLPMMMPKVMKVMLDRVAKRIPMPDYMAEQMPTLMPKVMDNLMPHMIGDVVPLVTQPMIDYLRGKNKTGGLYDIAI